MQTTILKSFLLMVTLVVAVRGHGMMVDPPERSSMWRFGYGTPRNYEDNQLYCGGFARQWRQNHGKCGVCGDPWDEKVHDNEAGGKFATGIIVKTYQQGQVIDVAIRITANHKGYFMFKLCPNNDVKKAVTQECLDQNVLTFVGPRGENKGTKFYIDSKIDTKHVRLQLPPHIICSQCVLQWTYNTGNSWGCGGTPSKCCIGCGPQENFVNCADVAITPSSGSIHVTARPHNTQYPYTQQPATHAPVTAEPTTKVRPQPTVASLLTTIRTGDGGSQIHAVKRCHAAGVFAGRSDMDIWCNQNCQQNFCPPAYCICS